MHSPSSKAANVSVACVLVLVTGLPAAGKSSLVAGLEAISSSDGARGSHGAIRHVFQIDAFMQAVASENDKDSGNTKCEVHEVDEFRPGQWKAAEAALHDAVEHALTHLIKAANESPVPPAPPIILVEDNMHLRSMREFYWRLCRRVEETHVLVPSGGATPTMATSPCVHRAIAMMEMRLTVPLEACLVRNAQRAASGPTAVHSGVSAAQAVPVPAFVIEAMADTFETCLVSSGATSAIAMPSCGPWRPLACTHPWPVFAVSNASPGDITARTTTASSACLVDGAWDVLGRGMDSVLEQQVAAIEQFWLRKREAAVSAAQSTSSCQNGVHAFDLHLRATVQHFFKEYGPRITPPIQSRVHATKRLYLQKRKSLLANMILDDKRDPVEQRQAAEQQLVVDFQHALHDLLTNSEAGNVDAVVGREE